MTKEPFVIVPEFVMELACEGRISPRAFLLYSVLRSYRNNVEKTAWPSNATLARLMGMSHRQNIPRLMRELVESGAVQSRSRTGRSNVYTFPETRSVITPDYTDEETVITDDYTQAETVITGDYTVSSQVINPCNQDVLHPVITGDVLTKPKEPKELTTSREHSVDTAAKPLHGSRATIQPPLLNSVKTTLVDASVVSQQMQKLDHVLGGKPPYSGLYGRGESDVEAARNLFQQGESLDTVKDIILRSRKKVS